MAAHAQDGDLPETGPLPAAKPPARQRAAKVTAPVVDPDVALRGRLIAALRPKLTATVAAMYVDQLLPEVKAYADDVLYAGLMAHGDVVASIVTAAQDCLDVIMGGDLPA